jgi:hypothetical protein
MAETPIAKTEEFFRQNKRIDRSSRFRTGTLTEVFGMIYNTFRVTGFEPAAFWSQTRRSTKLSYTLIDRDNSSMSLAIRHVRARGDFHEGRRWRSIDLSVGWAGR